MGKRKDIEVGGLTHYLKMKDRVDYLLAAKREGKTWPELSKIVYADKGFFKSVINFIQGVYHSITKEAADMRQRVQLITLIIQIMPLLKDKAWYQSSTIWGVVFLVLTTILEALGLAIVSDPEQMASIYDVIQIIAGSVGLFGLRKAAGEMKDKLPDAGQALKTIALLMFIPLALGLSGCGVNDAGDPVIEYQMTVQMESDSIIPGYAPKIVYQVNVLESNRTTSDQILLDWTDYLSHRSGQLPTSFDDPFGVQTRLDFDSNTHIVQQAFYDF